MNAMLLGVTCLLILVAGSDALSCYSCEYTTENDQVIANTGNGCDTVSSKTTTLDAIGSTSCKSCRKAVSDYDNSGTKIYSVRRECLTSTCSEGKTVIGSYTYETYCCTTDKCNSATGIRMTGGFIAVLFLAIIYNLRN